MAIKRITKFNFYLLIIIRMKIGDKENNEIIKIKFLRTNNNYNNENR